MSTHSISAGLRDVFSSNPLMTLEKLERYDVIIQFHSAEELPKMDVVGHADPYFVANIDNQITYTSAIQNNTGNPQWSDEIWVVRNIPSNAKMTVKVHDKDDEKLLDDYIGQFEVANLIDYHPPTIGHLIIGPFDRHNGYFRLSIKSMRLSAETEELPPYTYDGACRYSRHDSLAVGRLTMLNADCIYSTFKIQLRRISVFFPPNQRQHWNKAYKAAQTIFGNHPVALVSQKAIKLGHKVLYGHTLKDSHDGQITSPEDLWKIAFSDQTKQFIRPCVYTYIIDDNTWRFSETDRQFFADFASKHALLANCCEHVRYAGEFHPRPKYGWNQCDNEWELVFDNGSGTYSPAPKQFNNLF